MTDLLLTDEEIMTVDYVGFEFWGKPEMEQKLLLDIYKNVAKAQHSKILNELDQLLRGEGEYKRSGIAECLNDLIYRMREK